MNFGKTSYQYASEMSVILLVNMCRIVYNIVALSVYGECRLGCFRKAETLRLAVSHWGTVLFQHKVYFMKYISAFWILILCFSFFYLLYCFKTSTSHCIVRISTCSAVDCSVDDWVITRWPVFTLDVALYYESQCWSLLSSWCGKR